MHRSYYTRILDFHEDHSGELDQNHKQDSLFFLRLNFKEQENQS